MESLYPFNVIALSQAPADAPVVFVFPDAATSSTVFSHFAARAAGSYTILGLDPPGLLQGECPFDSIEEAAQAYIEIIVLDVGARDVHLIGFAFGALIAFEVALKLQKAGTEIKSLSLIDPPLPCWLAEPSLPRIRRDFVVKLAKAQSLRLPAKLLNTVDSTTTAEFVACLSCALSPSSQADMADIETKLVAHFETYRAARQLSYTPTTSYRGVGNVFIGFKSDSRESLLQWAARLRGMSIILMSTTSLEALWPDHVDTLFKLWSELHKSDLA